MTGARLQASQPIVFEDGTMQYHFRDFQNRVDLIIESSGTTAEWGGLTGDLDDQDDLVAALSGKSDTSHNHPASDIVSGTLANARISEGSVTQHQAALSITESQISDLGAYITDAPADSSTYGRNNNVWVVVSGAGGPVTSVAIAGTDGIEVDSGSPVTSSGTIQLGVDATTMRTTLNVEDGSTADQTNAEIETAYNAQVAVVSQVDAEAGTATVAERWTPERVAQAIAALAGGSAYTPPAVSDESATTYTMLVGDANKAKRLTGASPAITIPTGTYAVNDELIIRQAGTGTLVLTTTGLTINGAVPTWAQNIEVKFRYVATDTWDVV